MSWIANSLRGKLGLATEAVDATGTLTDTAVMGAKYGDELADLVKTDDALADLLRNVDELDLDATGDALRKIDKVDVPSGTQVGHIGEGTGKLPDGSDVVNAAALKARVHPDIPDGDYAFLPGGARFFALTSD